MAFVASIVLAPLYAIHEPITSVGALMAASFGRRSSPIMSVMAAMTAGRSEALPQPWMRATSAGAVASVAIVLSCDAAYVSASIASSCAFICGAKSCSCCGVTLSMRTAPSAGSESTITSLPTSAGWSMASFNAMKPPRLWPTTIGDFRCFCSM